MSDINNNKITISYYYDEKLIKICSNSNENESFYLKDDKDKTIKIEKIINDLKEILKPGKKCEKCYINNACPYILTKGNYCLKCA